MLRLLVVLLLLLACEMWYREFMLVVSLVFHENSMVNCMEGETLRSRCHLISKKYQTFPYVSSYFGVVKSVSVAVRAILQLQLLAFRAPQTQLFAGSRATFSSAACEQVHAFAGRIVHEHRGPPGVTFSTAARAQEHPPASFWPHEHVASFAHTHSPPPCRPQQECRTALMKWIVDV